jgi:hypothetical protein
MCAIVLKTIIFIDEVLFEKFKLLVSNNKSVFGMSNRTGLKIADLISYLGNKLIFHRKSGLQDCFLTMSSPLFSPLVYWEVPHTFS